MSESEKAELSIKNVCYHSLLSTFCLQSLGLCTHAVKGIFDSRLKHKQLWNQLGIDCLEILHRHEGLHKCPKNVLSVNR